MSNTEVPNEDVPEQEEATEVAEEEVAEIVDTALDVENKEIIDYVENGDNQVEDEGEIEDGGEEAKVGDEEDSTEEDEDGEDEEEEGQGEGKVVTEKKSVTEEMKAGAEPEKKIGEEAQVEGIEEGPADYDAQQEETDEPVKAPAIELDFQLEEEEESEDSLSLEESLPTPLDREPYFETYLETMLDYGHIKRLNNFLHKKTSDYFKKRKMEHVLREGEHPEEAQHRYAKRLEVFTDLIELDREQRATITKELEDMKALRNKQYQAAKATFKELITKEKETGLGLISEKTGKEIPDKLVDKLLSNQSHKAKELKQIRLTHIKIHNAVVEKHQAIRAMDKISDKYTLMEFEQMKIENQGHSDKIEERDEELTRLRKKCSGAIQCLAHVREKCAAIEMNIGTTKSKLESTEIDRTEVRERMNQLKQERDYFRQETQRMREEQGLLTNDKLLIDMEDGIKEVDSLKEFIKYSREMLRTKQQKLDAVRYNYEKAKIGKRQFQKYEIYREKKSSEKATIYSHRPTLLLPRFDRKK